MMDRAFTMTRTGGTTVALNSGTAALTGRRVTGPAGDGGATAATTADGTVAALDRRASTVAATTGIDTAVNNFRTAPGPAAGARVTAALS